MSNFKRKKPKKHLYILCCRDEALRMTGNHPGRRHIADLKKPQFHNDDNLIDPFQQELDDFEWEMSFDYAYDAWNDPMTDEEIWATYEGQ